MKNNVLSFFVVVACFFNVSFVNGQENSPAFLLKITNITKGQYFTPILTATHNTDIQFFKLGYPASPELKDIAEGGNIAPLRMRLDNSAEQVYSVASSEGLLKPGESVSIPLSANFAFNRVSFAAMLLPTNDSFVAINSLMLPYYGANTVFAYAYDAGTEMNDEECESIPGPQCGGSPFSPEDNGEGFVHLSSGIHGIADLKPEQYDWRGPVAKVEVIRVQ